MAYQYKIMDQIGVLSGNDEGKFTTEVNLISHNNSMPKIDIRHWDHRGDIPKMLKGIALTVEEANILFDLLNENYMKLFGNLFNFNGSVPLAADFPVARLFFR